MNKFAVAAGVAVLVAAGAGFMAWQKMSQADKLQADLTMVRAELDKARVDVRKAQQDSAAAVKESKELKVAIERLNAERDSVRSTIENEQANGVRLRAELALAKDQVSYLSARTSKDVVRGMPKSPSQAPAR